MYKLKLTRREKKELAWGKWIVSIVGVLGLAAVVWLAWLRPANEAALITSFSTCKAAGYRIQESYPEVCFTSDGKRFVEPVQDKAHQASLTGNNEPVMPTDPSLLYLNIDEWGVRLPLDEHTFDLTYIYAEDGLNDRVKFTYKRLINLDACPGDVGVTLSRLVTKREPPYTADNPAPLLTIGLYYYYVTFAAAPCYDTKNEAQVAVVKKIAGEQSLSQVTAALFGKLEPTPGE